jgi:hypothetical protein
VLLVASSNATAEQCESVIGLSKLSSASVAEKSAVEQHASNFCSQYSRTGGRSTDSNFGVSYKFLSLSSGNADTSIEAIASKYCSVSSAFSQSSDAYRHYIESIAPGAYESYQQCIQLANRDVRFSLSSASILPEEFSMTVSFFGSTPDSKSAKLSANPASGISCNWDGNTEPSVVINTGQTTVLRCTRQATNKRGYVVIARTDGKETMTIPWQEYKDGVPSDGLKALEEQLRAMQKHTSELESRLGSLAAQLAMPDARYVKSDDQAYVKRGDKIRLYGRPNTNECIFNHGGNGKPVLTGDCGNNDATLYHISKP